MDVIKEIEKVLEMEIEALQRVRSNLNEAYTDCVQMIQACKGQIVVTGLGKSGIIAQKIAATHPYFSTRRKRFTETSQPFPMGM